MLTYAALHRADGLGTAPSLGQVCQIVRQDLLAAFWSDKHVYMDPHSIEEKPTSWSEDYVHHIKDVRMIIKYCLEVDGKRHPAALDILEKNGRFKVRLFDGTARCMWEVVCSGHNSEAYERLPAVMQANMRPHIEKAEHDLNQDGRILLDMLRVLADVRELDGH